MANIIDRTSSLLTLFLFFFELLTTSFLVQTMLQSKTSSTLSKYNPLSSPTNSPLSITGAGHMSAMICMFLGEFTNPFHNGYYILQNALSLECCRDIAWVRSLDTVNTLVFAALYVVIRSVIGPVTLLHTSYDLVARGRSNGIPLWIIVLWLTLIWGVIYGSIPWVQTTWEMLLTYFPEAGGGTEKEL